ncbi:hypothetical protein MATL_G00230300 [Megalops atlanticus]|uniref:Keratinocyte associated protein 3 n=1 Tax=Megalops atlanticus TaxID=7932 RepID=A0A9D3PDB7_MEGAT|nr:hypothetical protein MATL_G00230300 [Megalops atlanticus]
MVSLGLCSASLRDDRTLMKMGLGMVLVGHINFLLGALVHGAVLRHVSLHRQARAMEYAISNVIALVAGMMAVVVGVSAIVLSKNRRNKTLMWFLLVVSALCGLLAAASTAGLTVSMARATANAGRSLLTHCKFPDAIGYSSITNECPFDPTRIYGTTIVLWVPLAILSVLEVVFSGRCFAACLSFLNLPCGTRRKRRRIDFRQVRVWRPEEMTSPPQAEPQRQGAGPKRQDSEVQQQKEEPAEQQELVAKVTRVRVSRAQQFNRDSLWI